DALKFVGRPTWEAISRNPVTTSVHEDVPEVRHVALGQRADLIIVAPATANTIAKMTAGIADDLLGTTLLATKAPVLIAPAMHTEMWEHPATKHNIAVLQDRGIKIIGPDSGRLTGDDTGPGRMSEPETIFNEAVALISKRERDFAGLKVLVTAGGTREPIDPVRYIGNRSSGKQGLAVAAAAADRGAKVELIAVNVAEALLDPLRKNAHITITEVGSTQDLQKSTEVKAVASDVICMVAAVSDYRVAEVSDGKMRKEDSQTGEVTLTLTENPDILRGLVDARAKDSSFNQQTIVGFAAETGSSIDEVVNRGKSKLARKGVDLLAVNTVSWTEGFETPDNSLTLLGVGGSVLQQVTGSKREVAEALLDEIIKSRG
ncbi:MAG TPA: bifunctional phosphopantothenoylcysteine decarboxylase/phosphopantothenate--cysteine ligase CoaBC, partial [Microbacteriaceae bacterium]|nr:bifunctional phosphopantothenoylcysteine decarboxylase/phosphopantothenate--cysteine ligase CoaBC [Microbacteriaceae bacterium]